MCVLSLIYSYLALCRFCMVRISLLFASLCYFLIIRLMFYNILLMFVFCFVFLFSILCICVFPLSNFYTSLLTAATRWKPNCSKCHVMSYHIVSYHIIIISCHVISYHIYHNIYKGLHYFSSLPRNRVIKIGMRWSGFCRHEKETKFLQDNSWIISGKETPGRSRYR